MSDFHAYQRCGSCSGRAQPGTVALMRQIIKRFPESASWGIYNCRNVGGSSSLSIHACGRAGDSRCQGAVGDAIVRWLLKYANEFGLMGIIWSRVRYDARSPNGRVYTGVSPHTDHIHWEQVLAIARTLTEADIERIAGPATPQTGEDDDMIPYGTAAGRAGVDVQFLLNEAGFRDEGGNKLKYDGVMGPKTFHAYNQGLDYIGRSNNNVEISSYNLAHIAMKRGREEGGGAAPDLSGLATKAELATHEGNPDAHHE